MQKEKVTVQVQLDLSTAAWLAAFAKANSDTELFPGPVTPSRILEQAAFCFADAVGRREGSWEADVGRTMLLASGFGLKIPDNVAGRLLATEEVERRRWLAEKEGLTLNAWQSAHHMPPVAHSAAKGEAAV